MMLQGIRSYAIVGAIAAITAATAAAAAPEATVAPVFDRSQIEAMRKEFEARLTEIRPIPVRSLDEWDALKADTRRKAMYGFGLDPLPDDVPLNIVYGDKREYDDCVVTKIMYQSFPGLYATAYLSVPKGITFPAPGIIYLQGHFDANSAGYTVTSPIARSGYVGLLVLTVHDRALPIGLTTRGVQLWNNIRGLDVLCSLPEVDKTRIGAYGSSGGGMQSMDLAAMDERVKAVVPISYPTAFQGTFYAPGSVSPCGCNNGPLAALQYMDNHWFLAMIAPRPLAVMCVTGDWTRNSIDRELPMVSQIYDLYRHAPRGPSLTEAREGDHVLIASDNGRFVGERFKSGHAQAREMYVRAFWWFDWWLKDKKPESCDMTGRPWIGDYGSVSQAFLPKDVSHDTKAMTCAPPRDALTWSTDSLIKAMATERRHERPERPDVSDRAGLMQWQQASRSRLAELIGEALVRKSEEIDSQTLDVAESGSWRIERLWFGSEPDIRIPAFLIRKGDVPIDEPLPATVMMFDDGKTAVFDPHQRVHVEKELSEGRQVLAIDQRWCGEWKDDNFARAWTNKAAVCARPEHGMAACDARHAAIYLLQRADVGPEQLRVVGHGGNAGCAALIAAALEPRFAEAACDLAFNDTRNGRHPIYVPGLDIGDDVADWAALVAPRGLSLLNVNPVTDLKTAERAYELTGATKALQTRDEGQAALVNGGFENGTVGWEAPRGPDGIEVVEDPLRGGNRALVLQPGQIVRSEAFPVEPHRDYYIHAHSLTKDTSAAIDLLRGSLKYEGVRLGGSGEYQQSVFPVLAQPGEERYQIELTNTGKQPAFFDCVFIEKGRKVTPGPISQEELLTVTSPADLPAGPTKLLRWKPGNDQAGNILLAYGPSDDAGVAEEDGVKALKVPDGKPYVVLGLPSAGSLRKGGYYRFTVTLRSRATSCQLLFWNIRRPRRNIATTGEWQTLTWDFFAESDIPALPGVSFGGGDLELRAASLRQIPPPAAPLPFTTQ